MNLLNLFRFENLKQHISRILKRFPVWVLLIVVITVLFFVLTRWDLSSLTEETVLKVIFSLILTFFLSIWVSFIWETHKCKINSLLLQVFPFLFWILFYLSFSSNFDNFDNILYFILTWVWIIWFLYISPFLKKVLTHEEISKEYYSYFYNISVVFLISTILWWVLFGLWAIGISAVFALFDLNWSYSNFYSDWAILALSFLAPVFALTQLPEKESFEHSLFVENKFFSFLVKYIAIPFIYVYFIILYAYSVKVLGNFSDWPKWEVSWMVIWFSIFGYLIYMFSSYFEESNGFIKTFRKAFPFVVIPQLFMLFYAIYLRIAQYDITVNRYFVVVFGIWLWVISLYFIISQRKQIFMIPAVLTLFTIIISIGPWWVYSLPETRQFARLENNLIQAGILKDGKIIPLQKYEDIDRNLSKEIYGWISYLCNYDDCENIKKLFSEIYTNLETKNKEEFEKNKQADLKDLGHDPEKAESIENRKYYPVSNWTIVSEITSVIKVQSYYDTIDAEESEVLYFYSDNWDNVFPLSIEWYNKLYKLDSYANNKAFDISYNMKEKTLEVQEWEQRELIDISSVIESISSLYVDTKSTIIHKENSVYQLKWELHEYTLILQGINLQNPLYTGYLSDWYWGENISWYLLQK